MNIQYLACSLALNPWGAGGDSRVRGIGRIRHAGNRNAENKQDSIQPAKIALLREEGIQALGFEAVARRAGLWRRLVRYLLADTDTLFAALCDLVRNSYRNVVVERIVEVTQAQRLGSFLDLFSGCWTIEPCWKNWKSLTW